MMSEVLGSPVYHGAEQGLPQEVGFYPLRVAEGQGDDPVVSLFSDDPVLFWHRDTHDLPADTALLASTDLYQVAAFRLRENAYGVQFHLETSADILQVWVSESPLLEESGADGEQILSEAYALEEANRRRSEELIGLFLGWTRDYGRRPRAS
jgi:GMP synthase (glutamine-hydrolysing)